MPAEMKSNASGSDLRPHEGRPGERDKALNLVLGQIERNFGKDRSCAWVMPPECGLRPSPPGL